MSLILLILIFVFSSPILAGNDIVITCSSSGCFKSSNLPFFNESNLAPGFSNNQTLKVINNRLNGCNLLFKLNSNSSANLLSSVQTISLVSDNTVWYSGSLSNLFDKKEHQLGHIDTNQYKDYQWTVSINQTAGNEYQQLTNSFDIDFNFMCDDDNNINISDSLCHDTTPSRFPQNVKAFGGQNSVTLTWEEPSDGFTYYLIAYSEENHAATYGNPNVGGKGTSSYTVNNLSAGTQYFFKIRTGNGCASGPFSAIISATPSGQVIVNPPPATSFQSSILGVQETLSITTDSVEGDSCTNIFPFAYILAFLINLIFYRYHLITFIISLLSLVFDYFSLKYLCQKYPYFFIANLFSFLLPLILSFKKNHKKLY